MRQFLLGLAAVIAAWTADVPSGSTQESFFNSRFCTMGGGDRSSGMPDCGYNTWEQCVASARGLGRYCSENPNWRPQASNSTRRTRRKAQR